MGVLGMLQWKFPPCLILVTLPTTWNSIQKHDIDASHDIHKLVFFSTLMSSAVSTFTGYEGKEKILGPDGNFVMLCSATPLHNAPNQGP